jgi:hypothetical protein
MTELYTQSKEYLVALSAEAFQQVPPVGAASTSQSFLFDAGATMPVKQQENDNKWSGTDWIYTFYKNLGVTFDSVYAWEPAKGWKPGRSGKGMKKAPGGRKLQVGKGKVHVSSPMRKFPTRTVKTKPIREQNFSFFPEGVLHFRPVGVSTEAGDRENPLAEIKRLCKPEDFVVFKLDIDSKYEIDVVRTLLADPELMALVDDFYYEHHVRNHVMRMHGLGGNPRDPLYSLKGWYDLVTPARRAGFRMHFWP